MKEHEATVNTSEAIANKFNEIIEKFKKKGKKNKDRDTDRDDGDD